MVVRGDSYWLDGHKRDLAYQDKQLYNLLPKDLAMRVCRKTCVDHIGPSADRGDAFFDGITYFKNSIEEFI